MEQQDYEQYIGRKCTKTSPIGKTTKHSPKPFKSGFKTNTIKGVINHPHLNIPAYIFHEDDSFVECRRVQVLELNGMEAILNKCGWRPIYERSIHRLETFRTQFRKVYSIDEISDDDLNKAVAFAFAKFGQNEVYNIYIVYKLKFGEYEEMFVKFQDFIKAFKEVLVSTFTPTLMIEMFVEYIYSIHIKKEY